MATFDIAPVTTADIRRVEEYAHELRGQALVKTLRKLVALVNKASRRATACPSCARPLRG